jgi:hypothetical protein
VHFSICVSSATGSPAAEVGCFYNGPDGVSIREQLVLLLRHDPQALAVAENWLWDILPECRGCACAPHSIW